MATSTPDQSPSSHSCNDGNDSSYISRRHCAIFSDVVAAHSRIRSRIHRTPVLTSRSLDALSPPGCTQLYFKIEALQKTGSFKVRGATNAVLRRVVESKDEGSYGDGTEQPTVVVTHSSGNHAQAVAHASSSVGAGNRSRAVIVMPRNSPQAKYDAVTKTYCAEVVLCENDPIAREVKCDEIIEDMRRRGEEDVLFVHPSEDPDVIAGQGTVCLEFVEQVKEMNLENVTPPLDVVIIPVGGGGLAAGNCISLRGLLGNSVKIVLAEPEQMDDAARSFASGQMLGHDPSNLLNSVADGLKTTLGPNTWPIIRDFADDILTVSEEDILRSTKLVWERMKILIEVRLYLRSLVAFCLV
mmetsp:Transcript_36228/g.84723  ORF Transcript_36228/g.84723 Transcript_36228/m.84723 type:complete len:355 (-) Transcript_36228:436-1500(-)